MLLDRRASSSQHGAFVIGVISTSKGCDMANTHSRTEDQAPSETRAKEPSPEVERVARSLCEHDVIDPDAITTFAYSTVVGYREGTTPATRQQTVERVNWTTRTAQARAVIDALEVADFVIVPREPSGAMLAAGEKAIIRLAACETLPDADVLTATQSAVRASWRAMVDAALGKKG